MLQFSDIKQIYIGIHYHHHSSAESFIFSNWNCDLIKQELPMLPSIQPLETANAISGLYESNYSRYLF